MYKYYSVVPPPISNGHCPTDRITKNVRWHGSGTANWTTVIDTAGQPWHYIPTIEAVSPCHPTVFDSPFAVQAGEPPKSAGIANKRRGRNSLPHIPYPSQRETSGSNTHDRIHCHDEGSIRDFPCRMRPLIAAKRKKEAHFS